MRCSARSSRSRVALASTSRSRCCSTTSTGARATKSALASFCSLRSISTVELAGLLLQPQPLGREVEHLADRQAEGRLVDDDIQRLRPAPAARPSTISPSLASRWMASRCRSRRAIVAAAGAVLVERQSRAPGGTFSSVRAARIAPISAHQPAELGLGLRIDQLAAEPRPCRGDQRPPRLAEQLLPQLLGDEGCDRMQQMQRLRQHPGGRGPGLRLGGLVLGEEQGLRQLDVPVAERVPEEVVEAERRVVEAVALERAGDRGCGLLGLADDPAVERLRGRRSGRRRGRGAPRSSRRSGRRSRAW